MTDRLVTDRPVWTSALRALRLGVILVVAIVGFILGVSIGNRDRIGDANMIKELTADKDKLTTERIALQKQIFELREQRDKRECYEFLMTALTIIAAVAASIAAWPVVKP